jgi:inosine-uridine nucleoside N-ribohydrolase
MLEVMLVHLDTDLGGDTDDACALALLLGQAGVELAGITTVPTGPDAEPGTPATACASPDARASR